MHMKASEFIDTDLIPNGHGEAEKPSRERNHQPHAAQSQSRAEIDARVEQARQQMLELRRQQEELERERQDLEDLRRREEDFEKGKAEMLEELSRAVSMIEQEEFELNKRSTLLTNSREVFQDYVRQLQDIRETEWAGEDLKPKLAKAVSIVEAARAELNKGRAQLSSLGEGPLKLENDTMYNGSQVPASTSGAPLDFGQEFMRGFARYLPLMLFGALALMLLLLRGR